VIYMDQGEGRASVLFDELRGVGLLDDSVEPHLTLKGRSWLRTLADVETQEVTDAGEAYADLIQSTNGIFR